MPTSRKMRTTTLNVIKPTDYTLLEAEFNLVRYIVPSNYYWNDNKKYKKVHSAVKNQLDYPYKSFSYDKLDGNQKWVIYVLYPKGVEPQEIVLDVRSDTVITLAKREIAFQEINLHNLIKLLQISYFHRSNKGRFVGNDECYVCAKDSEKHSVCLQIKINGHLANKEDDLTQKFMVVGNATTFSYQTSPIDNRSENLYSYYERIISEDKMTFFKQIKRSEVPNFKGKIYSPRTFAGKKTTLDYHSNVDKELASSRGKILYTFINGFSRYLAKYGFIAESISRDFMEFKPSKTEEDLLWRKLDTIYLYDNRLNKQRDFKQYRELFKHHFLELNFGIVDTLDSDLDKPLLIIQDHTAQDFKKGGLLQDEDDPYQKLYSDYPNLPKQSYNVNTNDPKKVENVTSYLDYPMLEATKSLKTKLAMTLNELYLKEVIIRQRNIIDYGLPNILPNCAFVNRTTVAGVSYEVMLYQERNQLKFANCHTPEGKTRRIDLARDYGLNWEILYEDMCKRQKKQRNDDEEVDQDRFEYYVILTHGQFIAIEDLNERVLYDYGEIAKNKKERKQPQPYQNFKLSKHYDQIRPQTLLNRVETKALLPIKHQRELSKKENASLKLYLQLREFDTTLDKLCKYRPQISLDTLSSDQFVEELASVFGITLTRNKKEKYELREYKKTLTRYYQRFGKFPSSKRANLLLYQGIWYTQDNCYVVGATQGLKDRQPRAHLVRQLYNYNSSSNQNLNVSTFLAATTVKFVRYNQYTVYPYYFHLINIYIENILRFCPNYNTI